MGVLTDGLRDIIERNQALDQRMYERTVKMVDKTLKVLDDLQADLAAEGDPKAEAIKILRDAGWTLTPPRS